MSNEDLDSQLSAMFDGELPEGECELVARRLARDGELRRRWHHYAVIGASIRAEHGVRLDDRLARRVSAAIAADPEPASHDIPAMASTSTATPAGAASRATTRWLRPAAAVGIAASVAAVSILWLRAQAPGAASPVAPPLVAATSAPADTAAIAFPRGERARPAVLVPAAPYTVPPQVAERAAERPAIASTELANYVVAHSEYSSPLTRRFPLSAIVSSQPERSGAKPVSLDQDVSADAAQSR